MRLGPDLAPQCGNAHQDGGAFCWIKWSHVEPQRKVAELERSTERLASNTSPLVEDDKGFRDVYEEGSFAGKAGQMVPLIELARLFAIRHWHSGGYPISQTGQLPNIYFIRKDEGRRAVRKVHQIHIAIKIQDLAHNDRHLLKPAAARTISNRCVGGTAFHAGQELPWTLLLPLP